MARPKKRHVKIVFRGRDAKDTGSVLKAVEAALRPSNLDIFFEFDDREAVPENPLADEDLETAARDAAATVLEEQERWHRAEHKLLPSPDMLEKWSADMAAHRINEAAKKRKDLEHWLVDSLAVGVRVVARLVGVTVAP